MNPGSKEAVEKGCTCPVLDNNFGNGVPSRFISGPPYFWHTAGCPVHDKDKSNGKLSPPSNL